MLQQENVSVNNRLNLHQTGKFNQVVIVTRLRAARSGFDPHKVLGNCLFATAFRPDQRPSQPHTQQTGGSFTPNKAVGASNLLLTNN
jgi:hypothetical protein